VAHTYAAVDKRKGLCAICGKMVFASDERAKTPRNTRYVHLPCCVSPGTSSQKAHEKTLDEKEADMMLQAMSLSLLSLSSDKQRRYESYPGGGGARGEDEPGGSVTGGSPPSGSCNYMSPLYREFRERGDQLDRGDKLERGAHWPLSRADTWDDLDKSMSPLTLQYRAAVRSHETSAAVAAAVQGREP
jgi:hypothetical protein